MLDAIDIQGVWWIPSVPEEQITGTLRFSDGNRPELSLIGSFREGKVFDLSYSTDLILGIGAGGERLTLFRCAEVNSSFNFGGGGPATQILQAEMLFWGAHFSEIDDVAFTRVDVAYDHLMDWARIGGITVQLESHSQLPLSRYALQFVWPNEPEVTIPGFLIQLKVEFSWGGDRLETHVVSQRPFISASSEISKPIDEFLSSVFSHVQNFLTFGIGRPIYPTKVRGFNEALSPHEIKIFFSVDRARATTEAIIPHQMLFDFSTIAPIFATVLCRWFDRAALLRPVIDLYFSTAYAPTLYPEARFLNLAQALESYHRRVYGGAYLDSKSFEKLRERMLDVLRATPLPNDVANAFEGRIKFFNELSLPGRIKDLLQKLGEHSKNLIPVPNKFARKVADTRNYLTHYDEALGERGAKGTDLFVLTQQVKFLLDLCFLDELGIPPDLQVRIVAGNQDYLALSQRHASRLSW